MAKSYYTTSFLLLLILIFCSCENGIKEKEIEIIIESTNQPIEFTVSYSGTAQTSWGIGHNLYFLVDYGSYSQYDHFFFNVTPTKLKNTTKFMSPYLFEPGNYEISGFWDWNDSGTIEDFEPIIPSTNVIVDGFDIAHLTLIVQDKTSPNEKGWARGGVYYSGQNMGSHHIYGEVIKISEYRNEFTVTNYPYDFSSGALRYVTDYLTSGSTYAIFIYWDLNDNEDYDTGEPSGHLSAVYISPGLPTVRDITLN